MEIYRECSKYDTSQIKPMHTAKFSLNPISLLIPHALRFVCSLSDLFPSVISKEQMGVLHIHPPLPSVKTNSKYLWPTARSPSLTLQYPPFTSAYSFLRAHVLPSLPIHSNFPKQTLFRISKLPTQKLTSEPTRMSVPLISLLYFICRAPWSSLHLLPFHHFILTYTPNSYPKFRASFLSCFFLTCLLPQT